MVFSPLEFTDRLARVRRLLAAADVEVCIVMAPDMQLWLSGLEARVVKSPAEMACLRRAGPCGTCSA